jgi:hypothetical protein
VNGVFGEGFDTIKNKWLCKVLCLVK